MTKLHVMPRRTVYDNMTNQKNRIFQNFRA